MQRADLWRIWILAEQLMKDFSEPMSLSLGQTSAFDKVRFWFIFQPCARVESLILILPSTELPVLLLSSLRAEGTRTWQELALWWQAGILQSRIKVHLLTELFEEDFRAPAHAVPDSRLCYQPLNLISAKLILKIK